MNIQIINVGLGNVASIQNMLKKLGHPSSLNATPDLENPPNLIILPGVGAYDAGMSLLKKYGWPSYLADLVHQGTTRILGICLGMQLLCEGSEEGSPPGLGLIPGHFKRFAFKDTALKVPHMGWNRVKFQATEHPLIALHTTPCRFYFVHSYYYLSENDHYIIGWCTHGEPFGAAIHHGMITGVQFHPEKSHKFGMQFFQSYLSSVC
ncbi:imidazole glycerol phosphate synthase subunit HisH [Candidatus Synechococcus calcipolaris G9]|uniref:Imidazole glycerol phosphate synthase subunit HisH n=1 Tax=Candidatus Synechococcus calcipolaris G9 TaxID=1497997 RepID=A0ABT6EUP7_9SYNE|nr:imidazole glycerol phosphate synthase subunit HisH [Candidatus Synechococcus calcipolaris]MDG2989579.1 imidazole glycerol phosphate synthase subunit HisH [Candidatus Synechococcus calcipolaris G9]